MAIPVETKGHSNCPATAPVGTAVITSRPGFLVSSHGSRTAVLSLQSLSMFRCTRADRQTFATGLTTTALIVYAQQKPSSFTRIQRSNMQTMNTAAVCHSWACGERRVGVCFAHIELCHRFNNNSCRNPLHRQVGHPPAAYTYSITNAPRTGPRRAGLTLLLLASCLRQSSSKWTAICIFINRLAQGAIAQRTSAVFRDADDIAVAVRFTLQILAQFTSYAKRLSSNLVIRITDVGCNYGAKRIHATRWPIIETTPLIGPCSLKLQVSQH